MISSELQRLVPNVEIPCPQRRLSPTAWRKVDKAIALLGLCAHVYDLTTTLKTLKQVSIRCWLWQFPNINLPLALNIKLRIMHLELILNVQSLRWSFRSFVWWVVWCVRALWYGDPRWQFVLKPCLITSHRGYLHVFNLLFNMRWSWLNPITIKLLRLVRSTLRVTKLLAQNTTLLIVIIVVYKWITNCTHTVLSWWSRVH